MTVVGASRTIIDFIENKKVGGLENGELLFGNFELVG